MSAKLKRQALHLLNERPLTLKELSEKLEIKEKRAYRILRSLFKEGRIDSFTDMNNKRRYRRTESESD